MKITRRQLRRIIQEAQWGRFTGGAAPLDEPPMDSGPMTPEDQQRVFDMLVDSGSEPSELKATGEYPDVESLDTEIARRYFKRKYDWLDESLLIERGMLPIMVNTYEDLDTMNRVANYALTNDIKGALADENVNYENLDLDLDDMKGWVDKVGKDDHSFSDGSVVPDNWDLDMVLNFMDDLEDAWSAQRIADKDAALQADPNAKEREIIGNAVHSYAFPEDIKDMTFQVRRRGGQPSNINLETQDQIGNIRAEDAARAGFTLDDIIKILRDDGAKERKKQKPVRHTPPMYD